MKTKRFRLLIVLVFFQTVTTFAQKTEMRQFIHPVASDTAQFTTVNVSPYDGLLNYSIKSADIFATLNFGQSYPGRLDYTYKVYFSIVGKKNSETVVFTNASKNELIVSAIQPEQVFKMDMMSAIYDLETIDVTIDSVKSSGDDSEWFEDELTFNVVYNINYGVDVRAIADGIPLNVVVSSLGTNEITHRIVTFSWENTPEPFPNYQFQLLRLYNTTSDNDIELSVIADVNWSVALNIVTESSLKTLTLTIAEGSGFYLWRVRPIGTYYEGGITNPQNYGNWSSAHESGQIGLTVNSMVSFSDVFLYRDSDEGINWIYNRTFTEGNRVSEQITYADDLMNARQTQTHLQSKDASLAMQSILDYSGRPSLTTLPVPVGGGLAGYIKGLVTNKGDSLYTADDFDKDSVNDQLPYFRLPSLIDTNSYFSYYSNNNPDLSVPTANGYPFSRTLYENGGMVRVIEQAGPGKTHTLGNMSDGRGRTVRTSYSSPSEDELIRIFGDEATEPKSVIKTTTTDQNNTTTVTYTSNEGHVIATCLEISDIDTLLKAIGSEGDTMTVNNSTTENQMISGGFTSSKMVSFSDTTKVNISYKLNTNTLDCGCKSKEMDCGFELQVSIYNRGTGNVEYTSSIINLNSIQAENGYKTIPSITSWTPAWPSLEILPGNYIILKNIIVTANVGDTAAAIAGQDGNMVAPLVENLVQWLNAVNSDAAMNDFYLSVQMLGHDIDSSHYLLPDSSGYFSIMNKSYLAGWTDLSAMAFDTSLHLGFNIPYIQGIGTEKPTEMYIQGACCGTMVIPLRYIPDVECYDPDSVLVNDSLFPKYSEYLLTVIGLPDSLSQEIFESLLPGYTPATFNQMIFHMITDKYYVGYTKMIDGQRKKPDSTYVSVSDSVFQYECSELWDCWKSIVGSYEELMGLGGSNSVATGLDGNDQEDQNDENTHDSHADEEQENASGWLMKWLVNRTLKKVMREDIPATQTYRPNLAEMFLNCAGHKFAAILVDPIEDEYTYGGSYTLSSNGSYISATDSVLYYDTDTTTYGYNNSQMYLDTTITMLRFPYIKSPVFAFKFFEYNKNDSVSIRAKQLELWNCFLDYSGFPLCENFCDQGNYHDWSYTERDLFYEALKNFKPIDPDVADITDTTGFYSFCGDSLIGRFDSLMNRCDEYCEDNRDEIRGVIVQIFEDNCYNIGGCPDDADVILDSQIDAIVEDIIVNCKTQCDTIEINALADSYPKCIDTICYMFDTEIADFVGEGHTVPMLLPECEMQKFNQIWRWRFVAGISNLKSHCPDPNDDPAWFNEFGKEECSNGEPLPNLDYSKTYKVETITGE